MAIAFMGIPVVNASASRYVLVIKGHLFKVIGHNKPGGLPGESSSTENDKVS